MNFRNVKYSIALSATAAVVFLNACRDPEAYPGYEYMPDMYRGPAVEMYEPSYENADSTSSRRPVAGTMPRGFTYFNYPNTPEGYALAGAESKNPLAQDSSNLAEGKRLYDIYCTNCHGANGAGDGNLVADGKFAAPPSYSKGNSSRGGLMKDLSEGKVYHTITYGLNMMGSHASQLLPDERWKIVVYVRQLQNSGATDVPTDTTAAAKPATATI